MKRKTVIKILRIIIADETSVYDMSSHLKSIVLCIIFCFFVFFLLRDYWVYKRSKGSSFFLWLFTWNQNSSVISTHSELVLHRYSRLLFFFFFFRHLWSMFRLSVINQTRVFTTAKQRKGKCHKEPKKIQSKNKKSRLPSFKSHGLRKWC